MKCEKCKGSTCVIHITKEHKKLCQECYNSVSELSDKQHDHVYMTALLILFAYQKGYKLSWGDAYAKTGHRMHSNHYVRLAVDLNLFKDGEYLTETEDHKELGEFWESIGGSWGGRFQDGNHYSIEYKGRK